MPFGNDDVARAFQRECSEGRLERVSHTWSACTVCGDRFSRVVEALNHVETHAHGPEPHQLAAFIREVADITLDGEHDEDGKVYEPSTDDVDRTLNAIVKYARNLS